MCYETAHACYTASSTCVPYAHTHHVAGVDGVLHLRIHAGGDQGCGPYQAVPRRPQLRGSYQVQPQRRTQRGGSQHLILRGSVTLRCVFVSQTVCQDTTAHASFSGRCAIREHIKGPLGL
jgi:hypothetical protein